MSIELDEQSKLLSKLLTDTFPNLGLAAIPISHYNDAIASVGKIFKELVPIEVALLRGRWRFQNLYANSLYTNRWDKTSIA